MTLSEFKAWLEGYEASIYTGRPTESQWEEIKKKISQIKVPTTPPPIINVVKDPIGSLPPTKVWY